MILVNKPLFSWYIKNVDREARDIFWRYCELMHHYSHRWHAQNSMKRFVSFLVYAPLLWPSFIKKLPPRIRCAYTKEVLDACSGTDAVRRKVLDVGSGISAMSVLLSDSYDYTVVDFLHGSHQDVPKGLTVLQKNWDAVPPSFSDVVVANDLFPNVDQRLDLFLKTFLPQCRVLALSLTYYNNPRYYQVKRTDGDEILHVQAWGGPHTMDILRKYSSRICFPKNRISNQMLLAKKSVESVFDNGRQVLVVFLRGDKK